MGLNTAFVVLCVVSVRGGDFVRPKALHGQRISPLRSTSITIPEQKSPLLAGDEWLWRLDTDDGLSCDEPDLRELRANWLRDLLTIGKSRVLARVADRLFGTAVWASAISLAFELDDALPGDMSALRFVALPSWPHEAVLALLSILIVFKTDQSYQRFWDGRRQWARVHSSTRSLAMLALSAFEEGATRDLLLAYAATFPVVLKHHLRGSRDADEMRATWKTFYPEVDDTFPVDVVNAHNVPSALLNYLCADTMFLLHIDQNPPGVDNDLASQQRAALWSQLQGEVRTLTQVIGDCERLKMTPIPLSYSRHASRYFTLYLLTLPFVLATSGCSPWTIPVVCLGLGYVLYTMDEISHVIEEPFGYGFVAATAPMESEETAQMSLARAGTQRFVSLIGGFYDLVAAILGYQENLDTPYSIRQLEVLPLKKYCLVIKHEIAASAMGFVRRRGSGSEGQAERWRLIAADTAEQLQRLAMDQRVNATSTLPGRP